MSLYFYVDMDGVLVNFDKRFQKAMPGVKEEDDWLWEDLHKIDPLIYLHAEPMPGAEQLWRFCHDLGETRVLTAIPRRWSWPDVTKHKREWMVNNLGLEDPKDVLFGPYAEDKQFHCKGANYVLIDDKSRNIEQWKARGGTGVLYNTFSETIRDLRDAVTSLRTNFVWDTIRTTPKNV